MTCTEFGARSCASCVTGMYLVNDRCKSCYATCTSCTDKMVCTGCTDKYYLEGTDCLPCTYPCISCITKTFCLTCGKDYIYR